MPLVCVTLLTRLSALNHTAPSLLEFYALVDFVNPGCLGSASSFRSVYEEPILASRQPGAGADTRALGRERAAALSAITASCLLRRTSGRTRGRSLMSAPY